MRSKSWIGLSIGLLFGVVPWAVPRQPESPGAEAPAFRRVYIPSDTRREGEIRWTRSEGMERVQIYLYTRSPGRAFRGMLKDEEVRCPESHPHHAISLKFTRAVKVFREHLREEQQRDADPAEMRRVDAIIDLMNRADRPTVSFIRARFSDAAGEREILEHELLGQIELPMEYMDEMVGWMVRKYFPAVPGPGE